MILISRLPNEDRGCSLRTREIFVECVEVCNVDTN